MTRQISRREFIATGARLGAGLAVGSLGVCLPNGNVHAEAVKAADEIDPAAVRKLSDSLDGRLIMPEDRDYEAARRIWNWEVDKHPGLIVRCAGSSDVMRAVQFARDRELLVAVRAGGHSLAGKSTCDGGIVIDLSDMRKIQIDPVKRVARADAGLTLGEFDKAAQAVGLATTLGTEPTTGIAGLTLGGGLGWLMGKYGLACDNLRAVELVTADGRTLTVNDMTNEDLYWAVRGAGANFGVVTSLEYQLHPVGMVLSGVVKYPPERLREVLKFYREFTSALPDEVSVEVGIIPGTNAPTPSIAACYCGDLHNGEKALKPLRSFGPQLVDAVRPMPYIQMQALGAVPSGHLSTFVRSGFLPNLGDAVIDVIAENAAAVPPMGGSFIIEHLHGAVCRVGQTDSAFPQRIPSYNFALHAFWRNRSEADRLKKWGYAFWESMRPFVGDSVYSNYLGDEGQDRARAAYGANYQRLVALKNHYDRRNFFRLNQNIIPTA
jgi:UDP-N-acetylenolpyruvoylglucosamine reductase